MLKIMRKFSVRPSQSISDGVDDLNPEKSYPVLVVDISDDSDVYVLISTDDGRLTWLNASEEECFLTTIDGQNTRRRYCKCL